MTNNPWIKNRDHQRRSDQLGSDLRTNIKTNLIKEQNSELKDTQKDWLNSQTKYKQSKKSSEEYVIKKGSTVDNITKSKIIIPKRGQNENQ